MTMPNIEPKTGLVSMNVLEKPPLKGILEYQVKACNDRVCFYRPSWSGFTIRIEARLFNEHFYKASHSKVEKERALHMHQTKTKHFIAKLFATPVDS